MPNEVNNKRPIIYSSQREIDRKQLGALLEKFSPEDIVDLIILYKLTDEVEEIGRKLIRLTYT